MIPNSLLLKVTGLLLMLILLPGQSARAYSVLTHQAVIDGAWKRAMVPLLQQRYPQITPDELLKARAYAYGGSIIQDMGYYPLGSTFFTDLTHYVRTGDFINNLLSEAQNPNEFAFALGALSHYYSDIHGHSSGTNHSVALIYPELGRKFGPVITYEQHQKSHTRTEFAFDVLNAARREYAPEAFRDFIGFKVARDQLERAFQKTYGLRLKQIFVYLPLAEWAFRFSVKALIPQFTKMAWFHKRNKIEKTENQAVTSKALAEALPDTVKTELAQDDDPGKTAKLMAVVMRVVPKVGPLSTLRFKVPVPEAETLFIKSLDHSVAVFESGLFQLREQEFLYLPSHDLDTGSPTRLHEYNLSDETHRKLLNKQRKKEFRYTSEVLQHYLVTYYATLPPPESRKEKRENRKTAKNLQELKEYKP